MENGLTLLVTHGGGGGGEREEGEPVVLTIDPLPDILILYCLDCFRCSTIVHSPSQETPSIQLPFQGLAHARICLHSLLVIGSCHS